MYDDILLPTDGSSGTAEALEHALAVAKDRDATVHGLYVLDTRLTRAAADDARDDLVENLETEGTAALDDVRDELDAAGVEAVTQTVEGVPHREILAYAEDQNVDLIVMGTHGRTGPDRIAHLGSTTDRVVKNGDHPVLVVDIA